jgi:hypothetical protein
MDTVDVIDLGFASKVGLLIHMMSGNEWIYYIHAY